MKIHENDAANRLFHAITSIKTEEECRAFFEDVCTIKEIEDMSQRFEAAKLLDEGCNYQTISAKLGLSTATISRVSRCLNYGAGGYRALIDREKEEKKNDKN